MLIGGVDCASRRIARLAEGVFRIVVRKVDCGWRVAGVNRHHGEGLHASLQGREPCPNRFF